MTEAFLAASPRMELSDNKASPFLVRDATSRAQRQQGAPQRRCGMFALGSVHPAANNNGTPWRNNNPMMDNRAL